MEGIVQRSRQQGLGTRVKLLWSHPARSPVGEQNEQQEAQTWLSLTAIVIMDGHSARPRQLVLSVGGYSGTSLFSGNPSSNQAQESKWVSRGVPYRGLPWPLPLTPNAALNMFASQDS